MSFNPITYLSQLNSNTPFTAVANVAPVKSISTTATSDSSSANGSSTTTPTPSTTSYNNLATSSLLGLSSGVLSALQGASSTSTSSSTLSGLYDATGTASSDPLYSTLLTQYSSTLPAQEAVDDTQAHTTQTSATNSPIQSLLSSYNATQNANTAALVTGAQSLLKSLTA